MIDDRLHPDTLRRVGGLLFGIEWQRAMAQALGPLHPDGPRDRIDDSLVRKWSRGDRPVPEWVPAALAQIGDVQIGVLRARLADLKIAVKEMRR